MIKKPALILLSAFLASCGGGSSDTASTGSDSAATTGATSDAAATPDANAKTTSGNNNATNTPTGTTNSPSAATAADNATFLNQTYQSDTVELKAAQLALQRTSNPAVRRLADILIKQHTQDNNAVSQLAKAQNVQLSNGANNGAATASNILAQLQSASTADFDRTFLQHVVDVHQQDLAKFRQQANDKSNAQTQRFVVNALPVIATHLLLAKEINASTNPRAFLVTSYQDGLAEIQLSQLALQKTTDNDVRQFAQMMIDQHTQLNKDITQVAQAKNVTLPSTLTVDHVIARDSLNQLTGKDFDKAYMSHNVIVHTGDVSAATAQSQNGSDTDVRALAARALPAISEHLKQATTIYQAITPSFLFAAFNSGIDEVLVSSLALQRANDAEVRTFAQRMIQDHANGNVQTIQLANQENIRLPEVLPAEGVLAYRSLVSRTGADFDLQYMNLNVQAHTATVALFTDRSKNEPDPQLKAFATAMLPALNAHLQEAQRITARLAASTGSSTTTSTTSTSTTSTAPSTTTTTVAAGTTSTSAATTSTTSTTSTAATTTSTGSTTTTTAP